MSIKERKYKISIRDTNTNLDLENIYLKSDSVIFIDELILWLEDRKKLGYNKIKPVKEENIINLITTR